MRLARAIVTYLATISTLVVCAGALQHKPPPQQQHLHQTPDAQNNNHNLNQSQSNQKPKLGQLGSPVGALISRAHNVSGFVFAVDEQTVFVRAFSFDGLALDAYFWSSVTAAQPTQDSAADAFIVPDEKGSTKPLEKYVERDIVLRLPEGRTLREIRWLSVWSRHSRESLGDVLIPANVQIPRPLELAPLTSLAHGVRSGAVTIVDAQTFLVADFHYDGSAPDAHFWLTRSSNGLAAANSVLLRDENGSAAPLRKYAGETIVISLPDDATVYDYDFFGVWCVEFAVNFGQTRIPRALRVPPSPRMLGIKPENKLNCEILYDDLGFEVRWVLDGDDIVMQLVGKIEPNEFMAFGLGKDDSKSDLANADAVVAWVDRSSGHVHAVDYFLGAPSSLPGQLSCGHNNQSNLQQTPSGACADTTLPGGTDSLTLLHGAIVNGYSMVTFKRPQLGVDDAYDQHVYSDGQQSVVWAIGSLNARAEPDASRLQTRNSMFVDFARTPHWNCPIPDLNASMAGGGGAGPNVLSSASSSQASSGSTPTPTTRPAAAPHSAASQVDSAVVPVAAVAPQLVREQQPIPVAGSNARTAPEPLPAVHPQQQQANRHQQPQPQHQQELAADPRRADRWHVPAIVCPSDRTFRAQLGPAAGRKGYEAITGLKLASAHSVAWYINGLLLPELVIERGVSYRFVVEGGNDKTRAERRHPLYLTDAADGGFDFKTDTERQSERVFAGVAVRATDGLFVPTAEGRLCEWRPTNSTHQNPDAYATFGQFQRSLKLDCAPGQSAAFKFTPDASTPAHLYYQCYTHRHLGWKIRVVDSCVGYLRSLLAGQNRSVRQAHSQQHNSYQDRSHLMRRFSLAEPFDIAASSEALNVLDQTLVAPSTPSHLFSQADFDGSTAADLLLLQNASLGSQSSRLVTAAAAALGVPVDELFKAADLDAASRGADASLDALVQQAMRAQSSTPAPQTDSTSLRATKSAKTASAAAAALHAYINKLAAQYLPSSIRPQTTTTSSSSPSPPSLTSPNYTNQNLNLNQQQPQTAESVQQQHVVGVQFSKLSNLLSMPKAPKLSIDLSKANLSKKLNKLRFKSSRKFGDLHANASAIASGKNPPPPAPGTEFNYDIFNNKLAQIEHQQRQLEALAGAGYASWLGGGFGGLSLLSTAPAQQHQTLIATDEQVIENMQQLQRPPAPLPPRQLLVPSDGTRFDLSYVPTPPSPPVPSFAPLPHPIVPWQSAPPPPLPPQTTNKSHALLDSPTMQPGPWQAAPAPAPRLYPNFNSVNPQQQLTGVSQQQNQRSNDSQLQQLQHHLPAYLPPQPPAYGSQFAAQQKHQYQQQRYQHPISVVNDLDSKQTSIDTNIGNAPLADYMIATERFSKQPSELRPASIVDPATGQTPNDVVRKFSSPPSASDDQNIVIVDDAASQNQRHELSRTHEQQHQSHHQAISAPGEQYQSHSPASFVDFFRESSPVVASAAPPNFADSADVLSSLGQYVQRSTTLIEPMSAFDTEPAPMQVQAPSPNSDTNAGGPPSFNSASVQIDTGAFTPIQLTEPPPQPLLYGNYQAASRPPSSQQSLLKSMLAEYRLDGRSQADDLQRKQIMHSTQVPIASLLAQHWSAANIIDPNATNSLADSLIILKPTLISNNQQQHSNNDSQLMLRPEYVLNMNQFRLVHEQPLASAPQAANAAAQLDEQQFQQFASGLSQANSTSSATSDLTQPDSQPSAPAPGTSGGAQAKHRLDLDAAAATTSNDTPPTGNAILSHVMSLIKSHAS